MRFADRGAGLLGACIALCACATTTPAIVTDVRSEYDRVRMDTQVTQFGAVELYEAEQAVQRLERAGRDDESDLEQLAYLARRRMEIAREAAAANAAAAQAKQLAEQTDEIRLEARTEEAEQARAVAISALERAEQLEADLKAKETERGLVLTVSEDVLFAFDKADLQPGATHSLGEVARFLNEYPDRRVAVEGHTDSVGSDGYNQELSRRRADAVAGFLRAHGVESSRLDVAGFGESMPVSPNDTDSGRQMNRRVEIILSNSPPAVGSPPPGRSSLR